MTEQQKRICTFPGASRLMMLFLSACISLNTFAGGLRESSLEEAEGSRNWSNSFDVSEQKPGTYNIYVEAEDSAGNISTAGPINIYVDPDSDLPIATIANPLNDMRVSGDLNIVGTCVDDDGVGRIELKIDDGEWFTADGKEFWSYYISSGQIPDGPRSISVRGVDIHGLTGPERSIRFDMDRSAPGASIEEPQAGALVSDRFQLKGSVSDENTVVSVEYSLDNGETYLPVKGSWNRRQQLFPFSAKIDTQELPDGPLTVLIRSVDGVGSVGITPTLFVVDNTPPVINLLSPEAEESVDRHFTLFGDVRDDVGIQTLSWESGKESGVIELIPGNPYWMLPLYLPDAKGRTADVTLSAVDIIGNETEVRYRLPLDLEADRPVVSILEPLVVEEEESVKTQGSVFLAGFARDDDGIAAVEYWIDREEPIRIETSSAFSVLLENLKAGKQDLNIRAFDIHGTEGPVVSIPLEDLGSEPELYLQDLVYAASAKEPEPVVFSPGMEVAPDADAALRLRAVSSLRAESLVYSFSGREEQTLSVKGSGEQEIIIPLPRTAPFGVLEFNARLLDESGRSASVRSYVYMTNYAKVRGEARFEFIDDRLGSDFLMRFGSGSDRSPAAPLAGRFTGPQLRSVVLDPPQEGFSVRLDNNHISIVPTAARVSERVELVGTAESGKEFRSPAFVFMADAEGPRLNLQTPDTSFVGTNGLGVSGSVSEPSGLDRFDYSFLLPDGRTMSGGSIDAEVREDGSVDADFSVSIDASALDDGPFLLLISAVDTAGNSSIQTMPLFKDGSGPEIRPSQAAIQAGLPVSAGTVRDGSGIAALYHAEDGENFNMLPDTAAYVVNSTKGRIKAVDRAGNESIIDLRSSSAELPVPAEKAVVEILAPEESLGPEGILLFRVSSLFPVTEVEWSLGSQKGLLEADSLVFMGSRTAEGGAVYAGAVLVKEYTDRSGEESATVKIRDSNGKTASASLRLPVDLEQTAPQLTVIENPETLDAATAFVDVSAVSPYGIRAVRYVLDKGEAQDIPTSGSLRLPVAGLETGTHTLVLTAVDNAGQLSGDYEYSFAVGGKAPVLETLDMLLPDEQLLSVSSGAALPVNDGTELRALVYVPNGLESATALLNDEIPVKLSVKRGELPGEFILELRVENELPYARNSLSVQMLDEAGYESTRVLSFYRVAASKNPLQFDRPGIYGHDARHENAQGNFRFNNNEAFILRFVGRAIEEVRLEPETELVSVSSTGPLVYIRPVKDGISENTVLSLTTEDGEEFSWGPVSFIIDRGSLGFTLVEPRQDAWYSDTIPYRAIHDADSDIVRVLWKADNTSWTELELTSDEDDPALFTGEVPLYGSDGGRILRFRAENAAGRQEEVHRVINHDTSPPQGSILVPASGDTPNGRITMAARFIDAGQLDVLEYSDDAGTNWRRLEAHNGNTISSMIDLNTLLLAVASEAEAAVSSDVEAESAEEGETEETESADEAATEEESAAETDPPVPDIDPELLSVSRFRFRATDLSGNVQELKAGFTVASEQDKPVVTILLPEDNEVLRTDFVISGTVFDDDAPAAVHYRIDDKPFIRLPLEGNSFNIPISLLSQADNEHTIEMYGEDMYGVTGAMVTGRYRISREEPKASITEPSLDTTVRGVVDVTGEASDANTIDFVEVSFDNALTFNKTEGAEAWTYRLDTRNIKDGIHSVYVRPWDAYETPGFFAGLISIDNTAPQLSLDLPGDMEKYGDSLDLSGRVEDSQELVSCEAIIFLTGNDGEEQELQRTDLGLEPVISRSLDLSALTDGEYGLRIIARDKAGNESIVSRDFIHEAAYKGEYIALSNPVRGESLSGRIRVEGFLEAPRLPSSVMLLVDGNDFATTEPQENGWFSFDLDENSLPAGSYTLSARFVSSDARVIESEAVSFTFTPTGPWIMADSFASGDYIPGRPWLRGTAGWAQSELDAAREEAELAAYEKASEAKKEARRLRNERKVELVEISLDNGRTFEAASGTDSWRFRLETQDYPEGPLPLILRVRLNDGSQAVKRLLLNLDKTKPSVALLVPGEGERFNDTLNVYGTASDDVELAAVRIALRKGDKASYQLPGFIQGLYLEGGVLGDTAYSLGAGLTFFDDAVKLQFSFGHTPSEMNGVEQRFYGTVYSGKLLANVASLPFGYFFGPDWAFLSANVALGAKFSYFTETSSGNPLILSAVVGQLEFPKITIDSFGMFSSYSFYTEFQTWFISAEIDGGLEYRLSFGLRTSVF